MTYLDVTTQVVLSPVPHVEVTVADSIADLGDGTIRWPAAGVRRTNADGTVEAVRSLATKNADSRSVFVDYECPQQELVTYQAASDLAALSSSNPVSDPVIVPDVGPWLIDPNNPAGSVPLTVQYGSFSGWTRPSAVSTTPIFGRAVPYTVESSVRQAPTGELAVWVHDSDTYAALQAILAAPGPKLFSWPRRQWKAYGQFSWAFIPQAVDTPSPGITVLWNSKLTLQPCDRPPVVSATMLSTWEDERGHTWDEARDTSWGDQ